MKKNQADVNAIPSVYSYNIYWYVRENERTQYMNDDAQQEYIEHYETYGFFQQKATSETVVNYTVTFMDKASYDEYIGTFFN